MRDFTRDLNDLGGLIREHRTGTHATRFTPEDARREHDLSRDLAPITPADKDLAAYGGRDHHARARSAWIRGTRAATVVLAPTPICRHRSSRLRRSGCRVTRTLRGLRTWPDRERRKPARLSPLEQRNREYALRPPARDHFRSHPCPGLFPIQATRLRVTRCSYGLTCRQAAATVSKPSSCRSCSRRRLAPLGASSTARAVERLLGSQALGPARLPQLRSTVTALPRRSAAVFCEVLRHFAQTGVGLRRHWITHRRVLARAVAKRDPLVEQLARRLAGDAREEVAVGCALPALPLARCTGLHA